MLLKGARGSKESVRRGKVENANTKFRFHFKYFTQAAAADVLGFYYSRPIFIRFLSYFHFLSKVADCVRNF